MPRIHFIEIEDMSWCPGFVREAITDILLALYNLLHIYTPAYQKIAEVLTKTGADSIIDCCSGSGGTIPQLRQYLNKHGKEHVSITLTDKFPSKLSFDTLSENKSLNIHAIHESIDATHIPPSLKGMRTFFSSFHHFRPEAARAILQDAVSQHAPIGIFESVHRTPADFARALLSPFLAPFVMPFSNRMTVKKFFFTYCIPVIPFVFTFDYIMSNLRAYSEKELRTLINSIHAPHYEWEVGKLWSSRAKGYVYYLVGYPK